MLPDGLPPGRFQTPSFWPEDRPTPEIMWLSDDPVADPLAWWDLCHEQLPEWLEGEELVETDPVPPYDRWPGLAPAAGSTDSPQPDEIARQAVEALTRVNAGHLAGGDRFHLALAPATRSADVPCAMGWACETHHVLLSALIRSWEDRFGVRVVGFRSATIFLSVASPPRTFEHAQHVALEHILSTADIWVGFDQYAASLVNARLWSFWWD